MRPIVSTDDAWYTNAALPRSSCSRVCHRWWCKNAQKMQHISAYNGLPWRNTAPRVTFLESSHRQYINMQCCEYTIFEIFALYRAKILDFGDPWEYRLNRGEGISGAHMYHHAKFYAAVAEISTGHSKKNNNQFHTPLCSVWRIINYGIGSNRKQVVY